MDDIFKRLSTGQVSKNLLADSFGNDANITESGLANFNSLKIGNVEVIDSSRNLTNVTLSGLTFTDLDIANINIAGSTVASTSGNLILESTDTAILDLNGNELTQCGTVHTNKIQSIPAGSITLESATNTIITSTNLNVTSGGNATITGNYITSGVLNFANSSNWSIGDDTNILRIGRSANLTNPYLSITGSNGIVDITSSAIATTSSQGALILSEGGLYVKKNIVVASTTDSTSTSTGSIVTTGGIGVAKDIVCGGELYSIGLSLNAGSLLTKYDEGTWSPNVNVTTGWGNISGTAAYENARYVRINNNVHLQVHITGLNFTSATAGTKTFINIEIPFDAVSSTAHCVGSCVMFDNVGAIDWTETGNIMDATTGNADTFTCIWFLSSLASTAAGAVSINCHYVCVA